MSKKKRKRKEVLSLRQVMPLMILVALMLFAFYISKDSVMTGAVVGNFSSPVITPPNETLNESIEENITIEETINETITENITETIPVEQTIDENTTEETGSINETIEEPEQEEIIIEDNETTEDQYIFYPNPVISNATFAGDFNTTGKINISIYNTTGVCLKTWEFTTQQTGQQEFTLNLTGLPTGIYFMRLQVGGEMVTKKVVKI